MTWRAVRVPEASQGVLPAYREYQYCHVVVLLSGPSVQMLYLGPPLIWPSEAEYPSPQRPVVYTKTVYP